MSERVIVLVATIPERRTSFLRLIGEVMRQSRTPDGAILVLDDYAGSERPECPLPIVGSSLSAVRSGAGRRWLFAEQLELEPDDILINLDDDIMLLQAPRLIEELETAVRRHGCAAAAMGRTVDHSPAPPGLTSFGDLVYGAGCGMALLARHLAGLRAFSEEVKAAGGPDALGLLGDDDALVSAFLWRRGIRIVHAATGNIFAAPNTQSSSQTGARLARGEVDLDAQKRAIQNVTGWPWA